MKKITHLDMSAIMEAYTAKVIAEAREADRIRAAVAAGASRPVPSERLRVTDLH